MLSSEEAMIERDGQESFLYKREPRVMDLRVMGEK